MNFSQDKPIYLQISDFISEQILNETLKSDDRLLSVREYGANIGVNPNTVMRAFERLTTDGIIYNKRGIGYFVTADAKEMILKNDRDTFINDDLPQIVRRIKLLFANPETILEKMKQLLRQET